ncbi:T9SS type A sorting domain-containing protein [Portibacter lacus]|uniref:Secretion system C-terminal sorting domain-containing protein n=1 Tax=Portibacter lacus TaxID=1099794 RepID=A0AA37SKT8_9BACT|nr:T9SS type A sorting domain-containing protein [Portibacter lacus]GLR15692.1 hypothetical protein GCM10007940_03070 [Portibacter lacus]
MNSKFTLTLLVVLCVSLGMSAQDVLWGGPGDPNGEFDGGLNDWTVVALSSLNADSTANALWVWDEDAIPNEGAYGGNNTVILSPSAANGAAYFDSDFLDNGGVAGAFGAGPAPSPQTSELISPVIDLSGEDAVALSFYQKFRDFDASVSVLVSNDGGTTFTSFPVSAINSNTEFKVINISSVAGGASEVVIKFNWTGDYYYWMIDDVAVTKLPGNDLAMNDDNASPFYTPHSAIAPACAFEVDTFSFSTVVSNIGADTATTLVYRVDVVENESGTVIYSDSLVLADFAPGINDSTLNLVNSWAPEGLDDIVYRIDHTVYNADNLDDFNGTDNTVSHFFIVDESLFSKEYNGRGNIGTWNDGGFYAIGVFYQFGLNCMENYTVSSINYAVGQVGADSEPLIGRPVEFWLWKLTTPLDSFDSTTNYEEDIATISHPSMEFIAFSQDAIDEADAAADIIVSDEPFLNDEADETTPIFEAGETYALFAHWGTQGSTSPLHLFATDVNTGTDLFYSDGWFGGFTGSKSAPILRLQLELSSSIDELELSSNALKVYPNPATSLLNVELNLENSSNATITIADITGKVISYQNLSNVQRDVVTLDVSTYVSGTYLARVATEEGTKTVKFIVD